MSRESNKLLMQRIFEGLAKAEPSLFLEHLSDDVTVTVTGEYSWSQTIHGRAAARRNLWGYVNSLLVAQGKTIPFRILADEDWVVVEARGDMLTKRGEPYNNHYCMLYRLENGMIVEMREYQDSTICERVLGPYPKPAVADG